MKVLLSAYACEPGVGSEPGVGWDWAVQLAKYGCEVTVVTRRNNKTAIDSALPTIGSLEFVYYDLPAWATWWKKGQRGVQLYYFLWQLLLPIWLKKNIQISTFDVVHHVTFGVFRIPSFLHVLSKPFVFGPVGGGETSPKALRSTFRSQARFIEGLRDIVNRVSNINPLLMWMYSKSGVILTKTQDTLALIPRRYRYKSFTHGELGTEPARASTDQEKSFRDNSNTVQLLFAGRLTYWKGPHLAIDVLHELKRRGQPASLSFVGSGKDETWLRARADSFGLSTNITWHGNIEQEKLLALYQEFDIFLFPSTHDSSACVVLEAMENGVPVICLDCGGPAFLTGDSSIKVNPNAEPDLVIQQLANAVVEISTELPEYRRRALARAAEFAWDLQVASMYKHYERAIYEKNR